MGADTDCGIVGDFEGVLPEYARAGLVRAGQQHASIGEDLDERIGHVGPALVVQAEIAHDAFVRPATTQETGPNEAGRVSARRAAGSNGRKYVSTVLAGIEEAHAGAVAVVVRQLKMTICAQLHGDLAEDVRRRDPPIPWTQRAGIETVGVLQDVLEARRAGVADADIDRVGDAG